MGVIKGDRSSDNSTNGCLKDIQYFGVDVRLELGLHAIFAEAWVLGPTMEHQTENKKKLLHIYIYMYMRLCRGYMRFYRAYVESHGDYDGFFTE